jgi:Fe-S-cluster-containing dehydrogenase component
MSGQPQGGEPRQPDPIAVPDEPGATPEATPEATPAETFVAIPAATPLSVASDAAQAAEPAPVAGVASIDLAPLSRRQLLKLGAAALPCLLGSTALFDWMTGLAAHPAAPVDPIVASFDPAAHSWAFVVDTRSCIGCGQCVVACKQENGVPLDEEHTRTWVERHVVASDGTVSVESPDAGIHGFPAGPISAEAASAGAQSTQFVPRLCMQCENSPCTSVCPVGATFRTADGVILVDEQRCIGCGYCVVACPYGARYIVPAGPRTPTGVAGVADKCTFCYHRITRGRDPACVEICPVGARKFGDLADPTCEVSAILRDEPTRVLRPELGTEPRVHYLGLVGEGI